MRSTADTSPTGDGKVLITIRENDVAPRFDLATEVLIASPGAGGAIEEQRTIVLPGASAEDLCRLVISEGVRAVICGGIEEEYLNYLDWKNVRVIDSVIGPWERALALLGEGRLEAGDILLDRSGKASGG